MTGDMMSGSTVASARSILHRDPDFPQRHITVTSALPGSPSAGGKALIDRLVLDVVRAQLNGSVQPQDLNQAIAGLTAEVESAKVRVTTLAIPVDGTPVDFTVLARRPSWAGICVLDAVEIAIVAAHVDAEGVRLVRMPNPMSGWAPGRAVLPPQRAVSFPDEALSGDPISFPAPEVTRVDLTYRGRSLLTGTYAGAQVELEIELPVSHGTATGTLAGEALQVSWRVADNATSGPGVPATVTGSYAGHGVGLEGRFGLEPGFFFDAANVSGEVGEGLQLRAHIMAADGGLSSRTINAEGTVGATDFSLFGTIDGPLERGLVQGIVGGRPFRLGAGYERAELEVGRRDALRVTGFYEGPAALLAVIIGALLFFL